MIGWTQLYPALRKLFGRLADPNDSSFEAEDRGRPRKAISDVRKFALAMRVVNVIGLGEDEERFDLVPQDATGVDRKYAGQLRPNITGQRKLVLQLECDSIENTDTAWAWAAIERIRTGMRRRSSLEALDAVDAALIRVGQATEMAFRNEGRMVHRVVLEVQIGAVVNEIDPVPTGWIEKVVITSHLQDVDGAELPHPPNVTNKQIPAS